MQIRKIFSVISLIVISTIGGIAGPNPSVTVSQGLWMAPADISSRDLFNGPYTQKPVGPYVFLKEDLDGTNPKFTVRDRNEVEWKVKIGVEARPEVAAARLLWAAGYYTAEYYIVPTLQVDKMPKLKRGQDLLGPNGCFHDARLKREPEMKKTGTWSWRKNPFTGTREFNGLRVMMALINNWDLKTVNNAIFQNTDSREPGAIYVISDLGSCFGTSNWTRPLDHAKGNLVSYKQSEFIRKIHDDRVDFNVATRPAIINAVNLPLYLQYLRMRWIGKDIPRDDARWIGKLLSGLSPQQVKDAFRAAGYGPNEVEGYASILISRIAALENL